MTFSERKIVSNYVLILAALAGANSTLVFKRHIYIDHGATWPMALEYCRKNYVDLSVIDSLKEYNQFINHIPPSVYGWIGLRKNPGDTFYQWSDGTVLNFTMWYSSEPMGQNKCIYRIENKWLDYACNLGLCFFCYSEVILVEENKTWDEALRYCRTHYTDLFSVTTQIDLNVVNNINKTAASSFWTGLHFTDGSWFWLNMMPVTNLASLPLCPNPPLHCGAHNAGFNILENRDCREKMYFACLHQGSG